RARNACYRLSMIPVVRLCARPLRAVCLSCFVATVIALALATSTARADDAGASIVSQSDAALRSLGTYQLREVLTINIKGRQLQQTTDVSYVLPDRSYVR